MAVAEAPRLVRSLPGRARIHLPNWSGDNPERIVATLGGIDGVQRVEASSATGNVLLTFDHEATDEQAILDAAARIRRTAQRLGVLTAGTSLRRTSIPAGPASVPLRAAGGSSC